MAETTNIEWCDATLSLWWGCTKVSDGCKHCYAEHLSDQRYRKGAWGPNGKRTDVKSWRSTLNKISKRAKLEGRRLRVFCQSMSDTFEGPETCGGVDSENWKMMSRLREELGDAIDAHPELDFLLLTKRPENVLEYGPLGYRWSRDPMPPNVWIGTSVEDQKTADERIPHLLQIPAAVRFLSCEPMLGPVDLVHLNGLAQRFPGFEDSDIPDSLTMDCLRGVSHQVFRDQFAKKGIEIGGINVTMPSITVQTEAINWVICGGESGANARPMHPEWPRSLRDQCVDAGVPFFFKQWGEFAEGSHGYKYPTRVVFRNGTSCEHTVQASEAYCAEYGLSGGYDWTSLTPHVVARVGKKAAGRILDGRAWDQFTEREAGRGNK